MVRPYKPHPARAARMQSAITLAKALLPVAAQVDPRHLYHALSVPIFAYTEADGKYAGRYRSLGAMNERDRSQLRHEHVLTRKFLVEMLLARPDHVDEVLASSLACIVTKEEDARLRKVPKGVEGWDRYRQARIAVWDGAEGRWLIPPVVEDDLIKAQGPI